MSGRAFFYNRPSDNALAALSPTITASAEDSNYPVANLGDFSDHGVGQPSLLTTTSGSWVIDFGVATAIPLWVLWHNFDAGLVVKIEGNASNSWGAPAFSADVTIAAKRRNGHTRKAWIDARDVTNYAAYRYWRISVALSGPANSVNVGLKVWPGLTVREFETTFDRDLPIGSHQFQAAGFTDTGYAWHYKLAGAVRAFQGTIPLDVSEIAALDDWFDEAGGDPSVVIFDPATDEAMIVRFAGAPNPFAGDGLVTLPLTRVVKPGHRLFAVTFVEVTAGGPEWD